MEHLRRFNGIPPVRFYGFLKECEWQITTRITRSSTRIETTGVTPPEVSLDRTPFTLCAGVHAPLPDPGACELGSEQKDDRRRIDPEQKRDDGRDRSGERQVRDGAEVPGESDQSRLPEQSGQDRSHPDVPEPNRRIRHEREHERGDEDHGGQREVAAGKGKERLEQRQYGYELRADPAAPDEVAKAEPDDREDEQHPDGGEQHEGNAVMT